MNKTYKIRLFGHEVTVMERDYVPLGNLYFVNSKYIHLVDGDGKDVVNAGFGRISNLEFFE